MDQVVYTGLFLLERVLKWFKPYLTKIQKNGVITTNPKVKYIFASWEGFTIQLTQIFRDLEAIATAERKLQNLI